jgi:hypothetical protein
MAAPRHAPTSSGDAAAKSGPEKARQGHDAKHKAGSDPPRHDKLLPHYLGYVPLSVEIRRAVFA